MDLALPYRTWQGLALQVQQAGSPMANVRRTTHSQDSWQGGDTPGNLILAPFACNLPGSKAFACPAVYLNTWEVSVAVIHPFLLSLAWRSSRCLGIDSACPKQLMSMQVTRCHDISVKLRATTIPRGNGCGLCDICEGACSFSKTGGAPG